MFTIHLYNLKFFSYHGLHEEERILGSEYEVNADIGFTHSEKIISIHQTVDYVTAYQVIKKQMDMPVHLLETLAQNIAEEIKVIDERIHSVIIRIKKISPPITSFCGNVGVTYSINL